ncbi:MAG: 1-acyl-sn-glycerol-3-phosphate acyltransferase [Bacteroidales bacterium]|nr:1-acyl-sn-glycerol-3-phosphate acyltransferase [Bacteroidales bacterium]
MRNVEKPSLRYTLLFRLVRFYFYIFFKKITITGKNQIPADTPVIFASNHQNALMDALAMLFTVNRPVVFLARADIFKNERIARLLNFLKILPVYRIRDGIESMGNNSQTFDKTVQVLQSGTPIGILPEGSHTHIKRLQQLKKGICRIAFQAAESSGYKLNIQLVPVGLDYTNYQNAGTHLLVNFGNPIPVSGYYDLYRENPQKAIALLRDDLADALKKVMIHVENEQHYHTIQSLTGMLETDYIRNRGLADNRENRFSASREIIRLIETAASENRLDLSEMETGLEFYNKILDRHHLRDRLFQSPPPSALSLVVSALISVLLLPVHLYGLIANYLPYKIPVRISAKMKDSQFISSVNFGLSFFLFPVWYLILLALLQIIQIPYYIDLLILLSWPVSGLFTFYHYLHYRRLTGRIRLWWLRHRQPEQYKSMVELREKLAGSINLI